MGDEKESVFDPYHKWLGISKADRPVTFYKLLGLSNGEADVEVIEEAAIRQTTHLRAYQVGARAADCTRLLNEVATARHVLVNPVKRKEYDGKLAKLAAKRAAAQAAATHADETHPDPSDAITAAPGRGVKHGQAPARPGREPKHLSRTAVLAVGGGGLLLLGVAILAVCYLPSAPIPPKSPAMVPIQIAKGAPPAPEKPAVTAPVKPAFANPTVKSPEPIDPNTPTIRRLERFPLRAAAKNLLALDDGRVFYGGYPTIQQFEPARKMNRLGLEFDRDAPQGLRFAVSPDGRMMHVGAPTSTDAGTFAFGVIAPAGKFVGAAQVCEMRISRDGKILVTGSSVGFVSAWNAETHAKEQELKKHPLPIRAIVFSRKSDLVATMCESMIQIWNLRENRLVATGPNNLGGASIDFSPDGRRLLLSASQGLFGSSIERLDWSPLLPNRIFRIAFADDKTLVALASDSLSLYDWPSCKLRRRSHIETNSAETLSVTPDGRLAFVGYSQPVLDAFAIDENASFKPYVAPNEAPAFGQPRFAGDWSFPDDPANPGRVDLRITDVGGAFAAQMEFRAPTKPGKARVEVLTMKDGQLCGKVIIDEELPAPWTTLREILIAPPAVDGLLRVTLKADASFSRFPFHRLDAAPKSPKPVTGPAPAIGTTPAAPAVRLDPPDEQRVKELTATIRTTYKADYAKKSTADRADLAEKLLNLAAESKDDPGGRYVLYSEACDVAAAGGNWPIAADALDDIEAEFKVDVLAHKEAALAILVKSDLGKESAATALETALQGVGAAVAADELPLATKFLRIAAIATAKAQSVPHTSLYRKADAELKLIHAESEAVQKARETLKTKPDDAAANLAVGTYEALRRGNWETAIPLLAKGGDANLAQIARDEAAAPRVGAGTQKIADAWWGAAEKQKADALWLRAALHGRAAHWYRRALPQSTGLALAVITERLKAIEETPSPFRVGGSGYAPVKTLSGHRAAVTALYLAADGKRLVSGGLDSAVKTWDLKQVKLVSSFPVGAPVHALAFSPNGRYLALGFKDTMRVVEAENPTSTKRKDASAVPGTFWLDNDSISFMDESKLQIATKFLGGLTEDLGTVPLAFRKNAILSAPDRSHLITLGEESWLFNTKADGDIAAKHKTRLHESTCAAFSPKLGLAAVATADKKIGVYDYNRQTEALSLEAGTMTRCLAYSPGGDRLVSGGDDGLVRIWDTSAGKEVRRFSGGSKGVTALILTPDGKQIIAGGSDGVIRVWAMPRERPVRIDRPEEPKVERIVVEQPVAAVTANLYGDQGGEPVLSASAKSANSVRRARASDSFYRLSNIRFEDVDGVPRMRMSIDFEIIRPGMNHATHIGMRDAASGSHDGSPIGQDTKNERMRIFFNRKTPYPDRLEFYFMIVAKEYGLPAPHFIVSNVLRVGDPFPDPTMARDWTPQEIDRLTKRIPENLRPNQLPNTGVDTEFVGPSKGELAERYVDPKGHLLGVEHKLGQWMNESALGAVRPIFDRNQSKILPEFTIAKEGYAVSGAEIQHRKFVDALKLHFRRIRPDGSLDPNDSYEGEWIGSPHPAAQHKTLGDTGSRVIGLSVRSINIVVDGISLVLDR